MAASVLMGYALISSWGYLGTGYLGGTGPAAPDGPDGRAKRLNEPARIRVIVIDRLHMRGVASAVSDSNGEWRVPNLDASREYIVVGFDPQEELNAAIQDWVKPHVPEP